MEGLILYNIRTIYNKKLSNLYYILPIENLKSSYQLYLYRHLISYYIINYILLIINSKLMLYL